MHNTAPSRESVVCIARRMGRRLMSIGGNRLELLRVELAEERGRVIRAVLFVLGAVYLVSLAGLTLTAGVVVALWQYSPALVLGLITVVYGGVAAILLWRVLVLFKDRTLLPCSVEQLRRDAALVDGCLKEVLTDHEGKSPRS